MGHKIGHTGHKIGHSDLACALRIKNERWLSFQQNWRRGAVSGACAPRALAKTSHIHEALFGSHWPAARPASRGSSSAAVLSISLRAGPGRCGHSLALGQLGIVPPNPSAGEGGDPEDLVDPSLEDSHECTAKARRVQHHELFTRTRSNRSFARLLL